MLRLLVLFAVLAVPATAREQNPWKPHFGARLGVIFSHAATAGVGRVVLLGDSNTEGFWWNIVGNCRVVNAGFGGARIADIADKAEWVATTTAPAIVHVMVGTNNLDRKVPEEERATEGDDLRRIIAPFRARGAQVMVWEIPPTSPDFAQNSERERINGVIRRAVKDTGVRLESAWASGLANADGSAGAGVVFSDGVHLTAASQAKRYARIDEINRSMAVKCP